MIDPAGDRPGTDAGAAEKLQWLMDRAEIGDVLNTYFRGVDHGDEELIRQIYHDDSHEEHGLFAGSGDDFAAFIVPRTQGAFTMQQHHRTTTSMDIKGDDAEVESYYLSMVRTLDGELHFTAGRYADRFERRNGRWAVAHRQLMVDWTLAVADAPPTSRDGLFLKGTMDKDDAARTLLPRLLAGGFFGERARR